METGPYPFKVVALRHNETFRTRTDRNGRGQIEALEVRRPRILAGASSADIRLEHAIDVTGN